MNLFIAPSNHTNGQNGNTSDGLDAQWKEFIFVLTQKMAPPLININLSLELLESLIESDEQKMYKDIMSRNSGRISALIDDLLQYRPLNEEQIDKYSAQALLEQVLDMAGDRILLKGITVQKKYSGEDGELLIQADKMKIALNSIVVNAIDAMTTEKRLLTLVARHMDEGYMIMIEDTGHGIRKDDLGKTYDILMSNYVKVTVESEEGKGTRVVLLFRNFA